MHTYRFEIEYAGTRFHGWQEQKNALTVSGELRRALTAAGADVREIGGAGRTDAGVHALHQVAHVRLEAAIEPQRLQADANAHLPADVNVLAVERAEARFHARHHAISRSYVYQIARRRTAFAKRYVWWVAEPLDTSAMRRACDGILGEHDFSAFCERRKEVDDGRVRLDRVEVLEQGALVLVRFEASHFLWRMVRRLTGALVEVARGRLAVEEFQAFVDAPDPRTPAERVRAWTAPASGLFLERVRYRGDPPLGSLRPAIPIE